MQVKSAIRLTIGAKISAIVSLLLLASVVTLMGVSTRLYVEDNTNLIQQMNADAAASLSAQTREVIEKLSDRMMFIGSIALGEFTRAEAKQALLLEFLTKDEALLSVFLYEHSGQGVELRYRGIPPALEAMGDKDGSRVLAALSAVPTFSLSQLAKGEPQMGRLTMADGSAAIALGIPFVRHKQQGFSHSLVGIARHDTFQRAVSDNDLVTTFLVDREGNCLTHAEIHRAENGENLGYLGTVQELVKGKFNNGQLRYVDPQTGVSKLGAFRLVGFAGLGVVAEVPEAKAFEAANWVKYRALLIAIIVLCASVLIGHLFSDTLTRPIYDLVRAAAQIATGDFKIDLKPRTRDEVGYLSYAFNSMAKGLEERDRYKNMIHKFHSPEIVQKLLAGEVRLGGERREATVLFTDIRSFTRMSESMAPEEVVEMLNGYLSRMVPIITEHGGVVDKYIGDAIMALWGVPLDREDDSGQAIRACLQMRRALRQWNEERRKKGLSELCIGMGLNRGIVTAGNIGSSERMEYTVIGDTVNIASRIEAATKVVGADLLVEKSVLAAAKQRFLCESVGRVTVNGHTEPIELFRVKGYYDESGNAVTVQSPHEQYAPSASDKVKAA